MKPKLFQTVRKTDNIMKAADKQITSSHVTIRWVHKLLSDGFGVSMEGQLLAYQKVAGCIPTPNRTELLNFGLAFL